MLAFVWAEDQNRLIGSGDKLPWRLPNDVKFFKDITMRGDILTGRKTYETIPNRPLKDRRNIVLTSDKNYVAEGAIIVHSKEEILEIDKQEARDLYIIGGAKLFELFEDEVDELFRTVIHDTFEGDVYFPESFDYSKFELIWKEEGIVDERNKHAHTFEQWRRKK